MKIGTLRKFLCTLSIGVALLLGMGIQAQAQRHDSSNGRWRARNYGQQVSARRHYRNELRRDLKWHQRTERRELKARWRERRNENGNSREWRYGRRNEREALRMHQREERGAFKERWKNNRRQR